MKRAPHCGVWTGRERKILAEVQRRLPRPAFGSRFFLMNEKFVKRVSTQEVGEVEEVWAVQTEEQVVRDGTDAEVESAESESEIVH